MIFHQPRLKSSMDSASNLRDQTPQTLNLTTDKESSKISKFPKRFPITVWNNLSTILLLLHSMVCSKHQISDILADRNSSILDYQLYLNSREEITIDFQAQNKKPNRCLILQRKLTRATKLVKSIKLMKLMSKSY